MFSTVDNMINFEPINSHYHTISILGQCCNGIAVVHLAKHVVSGHMVAIKRFNMDKAKEEVNLIEHEIILTKQLQHPNILKYLVAYVNGPEVCVVSPLMGFGSCRDLLNTHFTDGLPESAITLILRDVLDGLDYIHRKGLIHRAIRCSHILISTTGRACITGLRYACPIVENGKWQKQIHSFPASTLQNLNWLSPEVLEQNLKGYNEKSDIYSIGMVICELANGSEPYADMATTLMLIEKVRGSVPQLVDCTTLGRDGNEIHGDSALSSSYRNHANRKFSEGLHELAALCLQQEAVNRPSAVQLLSHPYFRISRKHLYLPDLLKPAIPLSDKVAYNRDELESLENIRKFSELDLYTCNWDF